MSTILEALKKSEQERKQKSVPTLTDKPPPRESSRWPWLLISLILLCLIIALVYLFIQLPGSQGTATSGSNGSSASRSLSESQPTANIDAKVEVVSWSPELERRFAMIDGKLMRVGDYLEAGVKIEEITEESVILNHRGERKELKP